MILSKIKKIASGTLRKASQMTRVNTNGNPLIKLLNEFESIVLNTLVNKRS